MPLHNLPENILIPEIHQNARSPLASRLCPDFYAFITFCSALNLYIVQYIVDTQFYEYKIDINLFIIENISQQHRQHIKETKIQLWTLLLIGDIVVNFGVTKNVSQEV